MDKIYIKSWYEFISENKAVDIFTKYLIDGKYLYHYTLTDNLDTIETDGLIPRKNPNSYYTNGSNGIFLTTSKSLYKANLPETLMDIMNDYYENDDDTEIKPIVRLTIDVSQLDANKFIWDDDYILNKYGWNKAETHMDKIIESLEIWGSVAYLGTIPPNLIIKSDFEYYN